MASRPPSAAGRFSGKNDYGATLTGGFGDLGSNKFNVFGVFDYYHRDLLEMSDTYSPATDRATCAASRAVGTTPR